jgi:RNA polymerase sigma-70 factor (ECF subfamily)
MTSAPGNSYDKAAMDASDDLVETIRRIGAGDQRGFSAFYDRFSGLIYSTALRVLSDPEDAEDVAQEVFFMLWEKAPMYDPSRGKPLTWVITMTRNRAIDRLRAQMRRARLMEEAQEESEKDDPAGELPSFDRIESAEEKEILRSAVLKLNQEQREAIEMAYFNGLTQQEIAVQLQEPLGTVKARIRRGIVRLRKLIGTALDLPA